MVDFFFFLLKIFASVIWYGGIIFCFGIAIPFGSVLFADDLLEKIKDVLRITDGYEARKLPYVFSYLGTIICCYLTYSPEKVFYFDFLLVFAGAFVISIFGIIIDNIAYWIKYREKD